MTEPASHASPVSPSLQGSPEAIAAEGPLRIDLYRVPAPSSPREKLLRLLWAFFQLPFLSCMPRALSPLRVALLRLFGAKIGPACLIDPGVKVWMPWKLTIGERSSLGVNTEVYNFAPILNAESGRGCECTVKRRRGPSTERCAA